jgi:hypothetical protein
MGCKFATTPRADATRRCFNSDQARLKLPRIYTQLGSYEISFLTIQLVLAFGSALLLHGMSIAAAIESAPLMYGILLRRSEGSDENAFDLFILADVCDLNVDVPRIRRSVSFGSDKARAAACRRRRHR